MGGYNTAGSCTTPKTCRKQKEQTMAERKKKQRWIYGLRKVSLPGLRGFTKIEFKFFVSVNVIVN